MDQGLLATPPSAPGPGGAVSPPKSMIERVTAIVDAFPDANTTLLLEDISQRTGLPRSTTHRILEQLIVHDWMQHTGTGYRLGSRAIGASNVADGVHDLRRAAGPVLQDLMLRTGLVVHLSVLQGPNIVYLDKLGGRLAVDVPSRVGNTAPANTTAGGKAMLSQLDDRMVRDRMPNPLPRRTDRSIASLPTLLMELRQIRQRRGLAFENSEAVAGIACIAAPLRDRNRRLAAVSLCGRTGQQLEHVAPLLVQATRAIASALSCDDDQPWSSDRNSPGTSDDWSPETCDRLLALAHQRAWM